MKYKYLYIIFISQCFILFTAFQCGLSLAITNGYEYDVVVNIVYDHSGNIIEQVGKIPLGETYAFARKKLNEYTNITSIRIETTENIVLVEYTQEYIENLLKVYTIRNNQFRAWIFTEKGLFLKTNEIERRFRRNGERILAYYRSDEAVRDLLVLLENAGIILPETNITRDEI